MESKLVTRFALPWQIRTYSKRSRSITGGGPAPATVQAKALIGDNLENAAATESLGVRLALDLQDVQGQENDFANSDQTALHARVSIRPHTQPWICRFFLPSSSRVQDGLASLLAKGILKVLAVVFGKVVPSNGLATILVYSLQNLCIPSFSLALQPCVSGASV